MGYVSFCHPERLYADLKNELADGLAGHMLVCVCLLVSSLNFHAKPEKNMPSRIMVKLKLFFCKLMQNTVTY
jgi:hypothetical protein